MKHTKLSDKIEALGKIRSVRGCVTSSVLMKICRCPATISAMKKAGFLKKMEGNRSKFSIIPMSNGFAESKIRGFLKSGKGAGQKKISDDSMVLVESMQKTNSELSGAAMAMVAAMTNFGSFAKNIVPTIDMVNEMKEEFAAIKSALFDIQRVVKTNTASIKKLSQENKHG
jgi:hypothetical protein